MTGGSRRDGRSTRRGSGRSSAPPPVTDGGSDTDGGPEDSRLFETFPDPLVRYGIERDDAVVRAVNPAFERAFDADGSAIADGRLADHLPVDAVEGTDAEDGKADGEDLLARLAEGERVTVGVRRGADDERRDFRLEAFPDPNGTGPATSDEVADTGDEVAATSDGVPAANEAGSGYVVYTDVTDLKRRERRLGARAERLERVASVAAHDLRNPLEVAKVRLEAARDTGEEVHFEKVAGALDRVQWLVEDVLSVGGGAVDPSDAVALDDAAETAWATVETGDAALVVEDDLPTVEADADNLRQLLENLFRNSVEHGSTSSRPGSGDAVEGGNRAVEGGGRDVTVTVGRLADGFYVADDGPGVASAERDRVFESGYSTKSDDAGLGLTIVRQIAEEHGWRVSLTTGDDGGARFEFVGVETDGSS